jgi:hypothetical protein
MYSGNRGLIFKLIVFANFEPFGIHFKSKTIYLLAFYSLDLTCFLS